MCLQDNPFGAPAGVALPCPGTHVTPRDCVWEKRARITQCNSVKLCLPWLHLNHAQWASFTVLFYLSAQVPIKIFKNMAAVPTRLSFFRTKMFSSIFSVGTRYFIFIWLYEFIYRTCMAGIHRLSPPLCQTPPIRPPPILLPIPLLPSFIHQLKFLEHRPITSLRRFWMIQ